MCLHDQIFLCLSPLRKNRRAANGKSLKEWYTASSRVSGSEKEEYVAYAAYPCVCRTRRRARGDQRRTVRGEARRGTDIGWNRRRKRRRNVNGSTHPPCTQWSEFPWGKLRCFSKTEGEAPAPYPRQLQLRPTKTTKTGGGLQVSREKTEVDKHIRLNHPPRLSPSLHASHDPHDGHLGPSILISLHPSPRTRNLTLKIASDIYKQQRSMGRITTTIKMTTLARHPKNSGHENLKHYLIRSRRKEWTSDKHTDTCACLHV